MSKAQDFYLAPFVLSLRCVSPVGLIRGGDGFTCRINMQPTQRHKGVGERKAVNWWG